MDMLVVGARHNRVYANAPPPPQYQGMHRLTEKTPPFLLLDRLEVVVEVAAAAGGT